MAYGPALIDAYRIENQAAIYPRIVLQPELAASAKLHQSSFLDAAKLPASRINKDFLTTSDGETFLNYLVVLPSIADLPTTGLLGIHKTKIEDCLGSFGDKPRIWEKYCWLGDYHNFIVREINHPELRIATSVRNVNFEVFHGGV